MIRSLHFIAKTTNPFNQRPPQALGVYYIFQTVQMHQLHLVWRRFIQSLPQAVTSKCLEMMRVKQSGMCTHLVLYLTWSARLPEDQAKTLPHPTTAQRRQVSSQWIKCLPKQKPIRVWQQIMAMGALVSFFVRQMAMNTIRAPTHAIQALNLSTNSFSSN